ncbi:MAG: HAMP domain-containing sensor histidine kinase, partial [Opitutales bacterium]|nr:HAMP domain-containing sensor histidine kinase [Opitutales bacterium]
TRTQELRSANHHLYQSNLELKRLNEVKSEFLGIAAHDLKNPLSAILGFTQIVAFSLQEAANGAPLDYAESIDMLQQVEHSVSHMVQVIHELINSESLDSGKIQLNTEPLDLAKVARKVVAINQSNAISKDIELRFNSEPDLVAQADALRIHEAMDNLISNAVKYSPFHSPVDISLNSIVDSDGKQWIRFSVKDHGPGLTETDKTKLFQRFQKLSARPTAGESSTGLGLSIVKSIIELHQGTVRVESEPGKGSTFSFDLPRAKLTTDL